MDEPGTTVAMGSHCSSERVLGWGPGFLLVSAFFFFFPAFDLPLLDLLSQTLSLTAVSVLQLLLLLPLIFVLFHFSPFSSFDFPVSLTFPSYCPTTHHIFPCRQFPKGSTTAAPFAWPFAQPRGSWLRNIIFLGSIYGPWGWTGTSLQKVLQPLKVLKELTKSLLSWHRLMVTQMY